MDTNKARDLHGDIPKDDIVDVVDIKEPVNNDTVIEVQDTAPQQMNTNQVPSAYADEIQQAQQQTPAGQPIIIIHNDNSGTNSSVNSVQTDATNVQQTPMVNTNIKTKNKWVTFALCLFLWWCGAYFFYTGWTTKGIIMIVLVVSSIGAPIALIWAFVDLIRILINKFPVKDGVMVK